MKGLSVKNKKNARKRIAVFVTFANSYGRQIIQGVSEYARVYGPWKIHLDYGFSRWSFPPWLEEWDGDGIVSRISSPEIVEFSRSRGIPVVDLNERVPMRGLPIVYNDNEAAGRLAAEHFLKCGCSRFGFIGQNGYLWSDERRRGFCERIREAGGSVEVFEGRAFEDWNVERADYLSAFWERERPAIREWIRGLPKPIAVLACNSFRAIQALEEAETVRVGIPEALALISGDDDEIVCDMVSPRITGIALDFKGIGYRAAAILDRAMNGEDVSGEEVYLPPLGVDVRTSTQVYAASNPLVRKALEFIRENARDDFSVADVADALDVSTSKLQKLFRAELNRSVLEQIVNEKIAAAKFLLKTTNLNVEEIAYRCGFNRSQRMSEAFLRTLGVRPGRFRKQFRALSNPSSVDACYNADR